MKTNKFWNVLMMFVLAFGTVFALASCGGDDSDDGNGGDGGGSYAPQNTVVINGKSYPITKCSSDVNSSGVTQIEFDFKNDLIDGELEVSFPGNVPSGKTVAPKVSLEFRFPDNPERSDSPGKIADYVADVQNVPCNIKIENNICTFTLNDLKAKTTLETTTKTLDVTISLNYNGAIKIH